MGRVWVDRRAESDDALEEAWNPRFPSRAATLTAPKLQKLRKAQTIRKFWKIDRVLGALRGQKRTKKW